LAIQSSFEKYSQQRKSAQNQQTKATIWSLYICDESYKGHIIATATLTKKIASLNRQTGMLNNMPNLFHFLYLLEAHQSVGI
jgi:hypothetical protein